LFIVGDDGWHHHHQQQQQTAAESDGAMPTSRRLLFVVCYATFRATYSIVVTFTLLMLLIRYANRSVVRAKSYLVFFSTQ